MSDQENNKNPVDAYRPDVPAKTVILRFRVNEFEGNAYSSEDHIDAIQTYFRWTRLQIIELEDEHATNGYFAHVKPFQAPEVKQRIFHLVLEIQQQSLDYVNFDNIPHEVYRVRRKLEGDL